MDNDATVGMNVLQAHAHPGQDRGPAVLGIQIALMVSAATVVLMRFVARRIGPGELWWDDWIILAALIPTLGGNITNIVSSNYGLGRHVWEAPNQGLTFVKTVIPVELLFTLGTDLAKGSVLLLYRRIFSLDRKFCRWINVVAAIVVVWCATIVLVTLLQCRPMKAYWDSSVQGKCLDFRKLNLATAIGHTITTLIVVSLPQPLIWKLNMNWHKKIAYSGMCFLGILTAIASVGRIVAVNVLPDPEVLSTDFTWHAAPAIIWYSVEPAIGIVCACLPCIGPIFGTGRRRQRRRHQRTRTSNNSGNSLNHIRRISDDDDASIIQRLGGGAGTCETSIYTAARDHVSEEHYEKGAQSRRPGGNDDGNIYVRHSTLIN